MTARAFTIDFKSMPVPAAAASAATQPAEKDEMPKLFLQPFRSTPNVDFGNVRVGDTTERPLVVVNPNQHDIEITFDLAIAPAGRTGLKQGEIEFLSTDSPMGTLVQGNSSTTIALSWTPVQNGALRTNVTVRSSTNNRFQLSLIGFAMGAREPLGALAPNNKQPSGARLGKPATTASKSVAPAVVSTPSAQFAKPTLRLQKPSFKSSVQFSQSTNSSVAYEEQWADKQERAFVRWINAQLDRVDVFNEAARDPYAAHSNALKRAQVRRMAALLLQAETTRMVFAKIDTELDAYRLAIRDDCDFASDIGIREFFVEFLSNYSSSWLVLAVETIFSTVVSSNDPAELIVAYFLRDPSYTAAAEPRNPAYKAHLRSHVLRHLLQLVLLLDQAKLSHLLAEDPLLFKRNATVKSSAGILKEFGRRFLKGEGDVIRHLSMLGYVVSCIQSPFAEFDFHVDNLATDLRDGVRLQRLTEILSHDWSIASNVQYPAIARQQKIHNIKTLFSALERFGVLHSEVRLGLITADHIVEGHREKTLLLLWKMILHWQVDEVIDVKTLQTEINRLQREFAQLGGTVAPTDEALLYFQSEKLSLLLQWCNTVCSFSSIPVINFTSSFSDGRALCQLISYYQPHLLVAADIRQDTTHNMRAPTGDEDSSISSSHSANGALLYFSPGKRSNSQLTAEQKAIANERANFDLIHRAIKELGGVPMLVTADELSNTAPDEKSVITFVAYLCSRLLDLRAVQILVNEESARQQHQKLAMHAAVSKIQAWWRAISVSKQVSAFQQLKQAAIVMQQRYRALVQGRKDRANYSALQQAAMLIEAKRLALLAARSAQSHYLAVKEATCKLQVWWCAVLLAKKQRHQYIALKKAAEVIAAKRLALVAGRSAHAHFLATKKAARAIQILWRANQLAKKQHAGFLALKNAAVLIATKRLAFLAARSAVVEYSKTKTAVCKIQSWWRSVVLAKQQRSSFLLLKKSAKVIETKRLALLAARSAQTLYLATKKAACALQARWRAIVAGKKQRASFVLLKKASSLVEAKRLALLAARSAKARFVTVKTAVQKIQAWWWAIVLTKKLQSAFVLLQKTVKLVEAKRLALLAARSAQSKYVATKKAAAKIQAWWRDLSLAKKQRSSFVALKSAAIVVQQRYRALTAGRKARRSFEATRHAAKTIETRRLALLAVRSTQAQYLTAKKAACKLQAWWRAIVIGKKQRSSFVQVKKTAILIETKRLALLSTRCAQAKYLGAKAAACQIQTWWRSAMLAQKQRASYLLLKQTVRLVAAKRLALLSTRSAVAHYASTKKAVLKIQAWWRGTMLAKKQRTAYVQCKKAVVVIGTRRLALLAARSAQSKYMATKKAAQKIQAWWRATQLAKKQSATFLQLKKSVVVVEARRLALLAARSARSKYLASRKASCKIQGWWRAVSLAKKARRSFLGLKKAAAVVETRRVALLVVRSAQSKYAAIKKAVLKIQAWWRATSLAKKEMANFQQLKHAAIGIQRRYRALVAGRKDRKHFSALQQAATTIGAHRLALLAGRSVQAKYLAIKKAACQLQSWWRSVVLAKQQRASFLLLKKSAKTVEVKRLALLAARSALAQFVATKRAVSTLQTLWRAIVAGRKQRATFVLLKKAVLLVQSKRRALLLARMDNGKTSAAAIAIQRRYRGLLAGRKQRAHVAALRSAARFVEKQRLATLFSRRAHSIFAQTKNAAITIQRCWRGYRVRKASTARLVEVRARLEQANAQFSEQMTLGNRTKMALDILLLSKSVTEILRACKHLEVTTRLSYVCCKQMVENNAIKIILMFIRSVNRSEPHLKVLRIVLTILTNLTLWPDTADKVFYAENAVDVFVELLQNNRENYDLFSATAKLLIALCQTPEHCKSVNGMKKSVERIRGFSDMLSNKIKIHTLSSSRAVKGGEALDHLNKQLVLIKQLMQLLRAHQ